MLESEMLEKWDSADVPCWRGHEFSSQEFVEENTERLASVERAHSDGTVTTQDFRRYVDSGGSERYVMLPVRPEADPLPGSRGCVAYICGKEFFNDFCKGLLGSNEISEEDYMRLAPEG